ncbi:MAG: hypothetical protein ACYTG5_18480 [Planctomycetota bacterium]|jgi:hypothetical protein
MLKIPVLCAVVTASGLNWTAAATEPAVGRVAWAGDLFAGWQSGEQDPANKQAEQDDPIEALRKDLMTQGVEARLAREQAVGGLLLRKEPRAHAILQEVLRRPEDPDGLKPFILNQLESKFAQTADPVFGDEGGLRLELIKSYANVIVRLIQFSDRENLDAGQKQIEAEVLACLRDSIRPVERTQVFTFLLDGAGSEVDPERRKAAMFAVAGCRDVSLIPLVASYLDDPELGEAARAALQEELISSEPFADKREFDAWWELNKNRTYIELIESAARTNRQKVIEVRSESVLELEASRLKNLEYAARVEDWAELQALLDQVKDGPAAIPERYLVMLRETLESRVGPPGGDAGQRASLVTYLETMLDSQEVEHRALILEDLAYLVTPADADAYNDVQARLRDSLHSDRSDEALAAFKALGRFASVENRRRVVIATDGYFDDRKLTLLEAGLTCLKARDWSAPTEGDIDRSDWVQLIESVFAAEDLAPEIKESAIELARKAAETEDTSAGVFNLLIDRVLKDRQQPARVRSNALESLPDFLRGGVREREDAYLETVIQLLSDPDVQMRKLATEALKGQHFASLPDLRRREWVTKIVTPAALQIPQETNQEVLDGLIDLLLQMNKEPGGEANVVGRLRVLAEQLAKEPDNDDSKRRRQAVVKGLTILGTELGIPPSQWVPAGEALLLLNDWSALRDVLSRQKVETLKLDPATPFTAQAFELVISAAQLRPSEKPWTDAEALELEVAFRELAGAQDGDASEYDNPDSRLLRLRALRSRQQNDQVVQLGVQYLGDSRVAFDQVQETQTRLLVVSSYVSIGNPGDAEEMLQALAGQEAASAEISASWLEVANLYRGQQNWDAALKIIKDHFADESSPLYRGAFLLEMDCRLGKDPSQSKEILALLVAQESVYRSEDMPEALRTRYEELVKLANDTN